MLRFPATFIFGVFATAYVVARFAPAARGPLGVRFQQVLRPNALALVPSQCVVLIITLIPTANPNGTDLGHLALSCFALVVVLAALPYEIALLVNSLSAGSGRSRLAVFLLSLLAEVITLALTQLVPALLARPFGVRLLPYNLPLLR